MVFYKQVSWFIEKKVTSKKRRRESCPYCKGRRIRKRHFLVKHKSEPFSDQDGVRIICIW